MVRTGQDLYTPRVLSLSKDGPVRRQAQDARWMESDGSCAKSSPMSADRQPVVRLAARGDGVTADGRFVALAAPGDTVDFAASPPVVQPGPDHVVPPCRHFPECGGCQMQHVSDTAYAAWAGERIAHTLGGVGVRVGELRPTHLSPPYSRRRAALRAVRNGRTVTLGFHVEGTHRVLDLRGCWVLRPELFALVQPLRPLLATLLAEGEGGGVSLTLTDTGIDALLSNVRAERAAARAALAAFAAEHDLARLSVETAGGIETVAEARAPAVRMGGVWVAVPPAPFLQATTDGEAALVAAVLAASGLAPGGRVADLFCGLGTLALPLAAAGGRVHAVDAAGSAVAALARAAPPALTTEHRDLFRRPLTAGELARFDCVVFDPPRAGAKAQVAELARTSVPRVIAVSCNPATFAREAATLAGGGYRLERLWPVAQFRWSHHLELVALFQR